MSRFPSKILYTFSHAEQRRLNRVMGHRSCPETWDQLFRVKPLYARAVSCTDLFAHPADNAFITIEIRHDVRSDGVLPITKINTFIFFITHNVAPRIMPNRSWIVVESQLQYTHRPKNVMNDSPIEVRSAKWQSFQLKGYNIKTFLSCIGLPVNKISICD